METKLDSLSRCAIEEPQRKFVNIIYRVNKDSLKASFYLLGRKRAVGVDGVSWQEYEEGLDANLDNLLGKMKRMGYRPQPAKRVYIPKDKNRLCRKQ
jgi:RNA-directed DNA polymerase